MKNAPLKDAERFIARIAELEAALTKCKRERDQFKGESNTLRKFLHIEEARTTKAKNALAECEREKGRLQDIIVKGRKAIEDAHDLLAETPRPDDRMSASTRDNHMIAWECICEALAALTEAGEGEKK